MDAEDQLVGKRSLKLINYFYSTDSLKWALYFANFAVKKNKPIIQ